MLIREMTEQDVAQVATIENQCFSLPWSENSFEEAVLDSNALFLVAVTEENVVMGYIGMYLSEPEGEITNVAVAEEYRGQSIGQSLVSAMQEEGLKLGITRVVLEVRVSNQPAIITYEKRGFVSIGVRKNFYEQPREDASIMVWES